MSSLPSFRASLRAAVALAALVPAMTSSQAPGPLPPVLFVSRQIPAEGSIYWSRAKGLPGVGPYSRLQVASPGKLVVREPNGKLRTIIDGASPTTASLRLIDVSGADVSYDATRIVFAGLPSATYSRAAVTNPGAWRLYVINVDGTGLRQLTFSESLRTDLMSGLQAHDDFDPAWLPDGRIVFASTRWPSYSHYSGTRTSNLYVIDASGQNLRRITAERNGADRPIVDPLTGHIVFARWWRNHRFAIDSMDTVADGSGGHVQKDGLSADRQMQLDGSPGFADLLWRNAWHVASIRPDGTDLKMWGGATGLSSDDDRNHAYGGAFAADGSFYANYFPMANMTEAAGFGGVRRFRRGAHVYTPVTGITHYSADYVRRATPPSFGIFNGTYATDPVVLPDGRLIVSWAADTNQDYGLYTINADGSNRTLLYNGKGTTEIRAKLIASRTAPVVADAVSAVASLRPPSATTNAGPFDGDGTFVFDALNVYANAPVDWPIVHAPVIGSASSIRFFIDHQRGAAGSFPTRDWPILLKELPVSESGAVRDDAAPANVPLFEQLRSPDGRVPRTGALARPTGAAHVAGLNYGRPGAVARCVGCHAGHTMIPVPDDPAAAAFSNLAPGARVAVSSTRDASKNDGLIDRLVLRGEHSRYWSSAPGQSRGQWLQLTFPVPVDVRAVRLYNPRPGDEGQSTLQVKAATVRLFADPEATIEVARRKSGVVSVDGTDVPFGDVPVRAVRVEIDAVSGRFFGERVASLAEIEVIARGARPVVTTR